MSLPLVSFVIVTWNRKDDIIETLRSIQAQHYQNYEIVVVDNDSTDGTVEALAELHPEVKAIALNWNSGPTTGRNIGVDNATGEIIFFIDSDASIGQDTVVKTVEKFESMPELGGIACKVVNAYTNDIDDIAGWVFSQNVRDRHNSEFFSYSFSECGCAFRKKAFNDAGQFWDQLFFGREGEELSIRIWDSGYKILYFPESIVYHRVSPSKRIDGGEREYFNLRNCLYIYFVRYPWWMLVRVLPLKVGISFIRGVRHKELGEVLRAVRDFTKKIPYLWTQRAPIAPSTAEVYMALQKDHGPLSWNLSSWVRHWLQ